MDNLLSRRSDLALEVVEQFIGHASGQKQGIIKDEQMIGDLKVNCIDILAGFEEQYGKVAGRYVSIDTSKLGLDSADKLEETRVVFSDELAKLLAYKGIADDATCLVIGLGNEHITPDALGPKVLDNIIVTRHLYEVARDELDGDYRKVSALAPGVMGLTGIETYDIIESVVKKTKPDFLIVIDALAARAVSRVNKMIQMTDTGIAPGSGVGNRRRRIDEASLGIPVIAIGIPTVVDAVSVTHDTIDLLLQYINEATKDTKKKYEHVFTALDNVEKRELLTEVLTPAGYNLIVTPKTIDSEMEDLSRLVSNALNVALHPRIEFSA